MFTVNNVCVFDKIDLSRDIKINTLYSKHFVLKKMLCFNEYVFYTVFHT